MSTTKDNNINQNAEFRFNCGIMELANGKVKPLPDKGSVRIYVNPDNLLCWEWNSNDSKKEEEPVVLFSDEWEWIRIPTNKGRVYQLKSKCFEDQMFYWLQDLDQSKEAELESRIKEIILTGSLSKKVELSSNKPNNQTNTTNNSQMIMDQITNALRGTGKGESVFLITILLFILYR